MSSSKLKLAIIGSRLFTDYQLLESIADSMNPTEIVSGGAKGADALAELYAKNRNIPCTVFLPKFRLDPNIPYHPRYFFERNCQIIDYCDHVLAFPIGESKGTNHAITYATKTGKPIHVV